MRDKRITQNSSARWRIKTQNEFGFLRKSYLSARPERVELTTKEKDSGQKLVRYLPYQDSG